MSKLEYNEIREKKIIIYNGEPCEVIESHVARTQQRKPQNQVKLKSLIAGKTVAATFHVSESADEADIVKRPITFLYHNKGEYWFCDPEDKSKRFKLDLALIGNTSKFLKQDSNVEAVIWENEDEVEQIIKVTLPIKMNLIVKEAPPAVRGDTSKGGMKVVTLENGTTLNAPMFINEGDIISVNTETGEYVERV
ncbi:MAG: Elongation factor P [Parcubacteria group bacterium GW2011_GWB1_36_5]|uniref:Elongation factor P n=1 Tax=Candidatus Daviesbacteria bacterium GW2011_GWA2_38_24 TaxID=1618422 RepID=A0A0G0JTF5_9BACT|nr:MAG: Elongation factor P [Parcubacteria group bacterium GW2011_GWB1_36_5]KKQ66345.1 MAG: Elongation factor P [Candidatus Daviesbacteria bacterium GW2011_GWA2_38_24]